MQRGLTQLVSFDRTKSQPKQLLKWIGNKQRFAKKIIEFIPKDYNMYIEPFLGSGAVLGALAPRKAIAGDILPYLIDIWKTVQNDPEKIISHYKFLLREYTQDPKRTYLKVRERFNQNQNSYDLLFLSRTCYGGIIRFTKMGRMSTL